MVEAGLGEDTPLPLAIRAKIKGEVEHEAEEVVGCEAEHNFGQRALRCRHREHRGDDKGAERRHC